MEEDLSAIETTEGGGKQLLAEMSTRQQVLDKDPTISPESFPPYSGLDSERVIVKNYLETPVEEETGFIRPFKDARDHPVSVLSRKFVGESLEHYAPTNKEQQRILKLNFGLDKLDEQFQEYEGLPTIIELSVLEDRLIRRLEAASSEQKPMLEENLQEIQKELNSKMTGLGGEIKPHLDQMHERLRPFFEDIERATFLLKSKFAQLLGEEEVERRVMEFWKNTYILPKSLYEKACLGQGNIDPKFNPGFVGHGFFDESTVDALFVSASQEGLEYASEVFTHEAVHLLSPPTEKTKIKPTQFDELGASTERITEHMGPLFTKKRDYYFNATSESELNPSSRAWLVEEINYNNSEWRLWEAITDWQANEIFSEIHPGHQFKTGYKERVLISRIVEMGDESGVDVRTAIKKGLAIGDKSDLIGVLGRILGNGDHYEVLLSFMDKSEKLDAEEHDKKIYPQRFQDEIIKPAYSYFDQCTVKGNFSSVSSDGSSK